MYGNLATAARKVVAELHAEEAVLVTPLCLPTRLGALRRPLAEPRMHALPIVMPDGARRRTRDQSLQISGSQVQKAASHCVANRVKSCTSVSTPRLFRPALSR